MPPAQIEFDEIHGWTVALSPEGNVPRYLMKDGSISTYLPVAQPHLWRNDTREQAVALATEHGYTVRTANRT